MIEVEVTAANDPLAKAIVIFPATMCEKFVNVATPAETG